MANVQLAVAGDDTTQVILSVPGVQGPAGSNLPPSGTTHQLLYKQSSTDYDTAWKLITNDNVDAAAAIAGTKISPNFGSQNVLTTGTSTAASFIPSSSSVPTNGLYLPAANSVALSTNGTGRLFVDANGRVGINGAPSLWLLEVKQDSASSAGGAYPVIQVNNPNANGFAGVYLNDSTAQAGLETQRNTGHLGLQAGGQERLRITSAGLVGIGTSAPATLLEVRSATTNAARLRVTGTGTTAGNFRGYEFGNGSVFKGGLLQDESTDLISIFTPVGGQSVNITSAGSVGIGTTSPRFLVSLGSTSATGSSAPDTIDLGGTFSSTAGANPKLRLYWDGSQSYGFGVSSGQLDYMVAGAAAHVWHINNSERARIDSSGRLLVGTSSSPSAGLGQYALAVVQGYAGSTTGEGILSIARGKAATALVNTDTVGQIAFTDNAGNTFAKIVSFVDGTVSSTSDLPGALSFSTTADGASSPTERMRITSAGSAQFAAATTGIVSGSASAAGTTYTTFIGQYNTAGGPGTGTNSFLVYTNGDVQNTNNSYGAFSDIKLKENIVDASSQWDDLKALQVRKYNLKEGQTHTQIGLIAQEVELVSPGLVSESPDRDEEGNDLGTVTKSVNYSVLYMKAVKALQEAMERIETLEASNTDLLARVSALESA